MAEEFPEHEKMRKHVEANWAIRDFLNHLSSQGIFLARYNSLRHQIEGLSMTVPERHLLAWRGADPDAYEAESRVLDERYGVKKMVAKLAPELGRPLDHLPPLVAPAPVQQSTEEISAEQALLDRIRGSRK